MSDTVNEQMEAPAKTIDSANLTQSEYETLRRGEALEASENEADEQSESEKDETDQESDTDKDESKDDEESEDSEDDDSEDSDDDEDDSEDDEQKPKNQKRKSGFKKRIDKLNARVSERERRIQELEAEMQRIQESSRRNEPEEKKQALEASDRPQKPVEDDFENYSDYEKAHDKYLDDLTDWKVEQKFKAQEQQQKLTQEQKAYEEMNSKHAQRVQEFAKENPDFQTVVSEGLAGANISAALETIVLESDVSAELIYNLALDPEEFDRISTLPPLRLAREIGKIEAQILGKKETKSEHQETKKTTKAPKPLGKVGTKGKGSVRSLYDAQSMSQSEWERQRNEQLKKRNSY